MRLHEYQAKRILVRFGVPVPRGRAATSVDEVRQIAEWLGKRVVLKAQVLTGGRGRAGGIRLANDAAEAERLSRQMFGRQIHGYVTAKVLVDESIEIEREIYLGVSIDRGSARATLLASAEGGVEISEVAQDTPERVHRVRIDPLLGLRTYQVRGLAHGIGLDREQIGRFERVAMGLYQALVQSDATLVEANPLVVSPGGDLVSLNSKMVIDDSALFRHRDLAEMRDESQETDAERMARRHGIHFVRLGGQVGCVSNGAGLAMATMDLLRLCGVRAANSVDIGMGAQVDKVVVGLRLAMTNSVGAVLVNIFGSVTLCDEIARGILAAYDESPVGPPLVIRLEGTNWEVGRSLLAESSLTRGDGRVRLAVSTEDAVRQVVALVQKQGRTEQV